MCNLRRFTVGLLASVLLVGCGAEVPTVSTVEHLGQLRFGGGVNVAESFPVQLGFTLEIRNSADRGLELLSDGCGVRPEAYATATRKGNPAWDRRGAGPCLASVAPLTIPAGDTVSLRREYTAAEVLGDSLPDGRYYFTVTYRTSLIDSEEVRPVRVLAGEAMLELPR